MPPENAQVQLLHEIQHVWTNAGGHERTTLFAGGFCELRVPRVQLSPKEAMFRGFFAPAGGSSHGLVSSSGFFWNEYDTVRPVDGEIFCLWATERITYTRGQKPALDGRLEVDLILHFRKNYLHCRKPVFEAEVALPPLTEKERTC